MASGRRPYKRHFWNSRGDRVSECNFIWSSDRPYQAFFAIFALLPTRTSTSRIAYFCDVGTVTYVDTVCDKSAQGLVVWICLIVMICHTSGINIIKKWRTVWTDCFSFLELEVFLPIAVIIIMPIWNITAVTNNRINY